MKLRDLLFVLALLSVGCHELLGAEEPFPASVLLEEEGASAEGSLVGKKRQMMGLYHELGAEIEAEKLAREILREAPMDRGAFSVLSTQYLTQKRIPELREVVSQWQKELPDDRESRYFQAAGLMVEEREREALQIHQSQLPLYGGVASYPYLEDLGVAAAADGNLPLAIDAYRAYLERHALDDVGRGPIRQTLDGWYREYLPQVEYRCSFLDLESGTVVENQLTGSAPIGERQRILFTGKRKDLMMNAGGGIRSRTASFHEGMAGWETTWSRDWKTRLWVGGGELGPWGGGEVDHRPTRWFRQTLQAFANEPAEDSMAFELLGGRQHRVTHQSEWNLTRNDTINMDWNVRKLQMGDQTYGESWGGNWRYERQLFTIPFDCRIGYLGSFQGVHHRSTGVSRGGDLALEDADAETQDTLMRGLVADQLHREGAFARIPLDMIPQLLRSELSMRSEYDMEETAWIYTGGGEFHYTVNKFFEVTFGAEYSTGASSSNISSETILLKTGAQIYF